MAPPDGWTPEDTERIRRALEKVAGRGRPRILMAPTTIRKLQALGLAAALVLDSALPCSASPADTSAAGGGFGRDHEGAVRFSATRTVVGPARRLGRGVRRDRRGSGRRGAAPGARRDGRSRTARLARDVARTADTAGHRLAGGSRLPGGADDPGRGRLRPADRPAGAGDRVRVVAHSRRPCGRPTGRRHRGRDRRRGLGVRRPRRAVGEPGRPDAHPSGDQRGGCSGRTAGSEQERWHP